MLFVFYDDNSSNVGGQANGTSVSGDVPMSNSTETTESTTSSPSVLKHPRKSVKQDAVDDFLDNQDGKIPRQRDPKMCKHGPKGMCDYCMPLEVLPTKRKR